MGPSHGNHRQKGHVDLGDDSNSIRPLPPHLHPLSTSCCFRCFSLISLCFPVPRRGKSCLFYCKIHRDGLWLSWLVGAPSLDHEEPQRKWRHAQLWCNQIHGQRRLIPGKCRQVVEMPGAVSWGDKITAVRFRKQATKGKTYHYTIKDNSWNIWMPFFFPTEKGHFLFRLLKIGIGNCGHFKVFF